MKTIGQKSVDQAFSSGVAHNVTVVMKQVGEWYFTFEAIDPVSKKPVRFSQRTQRGGLRLWTDPDTLFRYLLSRYGVQAGVFYLNKENQVESNSGGKEQSD